MPDVGLFGISLTETSKLVLEPLAADAALTQQNPVQEMWGWWG